MTAHKIFDGAFVMYSDMHLKECTSYFQSSTDSSLLYIDHCREGRIESEIDNHAYSYLQENEMRVDDRRSHSGRFCFPLCHYHGMTLGFDLDIAVPALKDFFGGFSVDLYELQKKYCNDKKPFVIHNEPGIEHIFSELYFVPQQIKSDYYKVKALELLLYLDALQFSDSKEDRPYFYKGQVEKIKAIHDLITANLQEHYTMDELAERFQISLTGMKTCFKEIYGDYMQFRQTPEGKNVFISIDSRLSNHNPLYKAWKTKSFTDGDITLHFILFDILFDPSIEMSFSEITDKIDERLSRFSELRMFAESTVRKRL